MWLFLDTKTRLFLPISYSWTWHKNKSRVLWGRAAETGDAVRYPCNFWRYTDVMWYCFHPWEETICGIETY